MKLHQHRTRFGTEAGDWFSVTYLAHKIT